MAILIQKLTNIVNIIDDTRPAGQTIINSLSVDCVAKVQHKTPNPSTINIMDGEGMPTQVITFDGTVKVQDFGGAPVVFAGTLDELCDKLNDEYFDNAVTSSGGGGGGGDATAANQVLEIAELQTIAANNLPAEVTGFVTVTPLGIGGAFDSGVLDVNGRTQVQTEILASHDGTINISFCADAGGLDVVRSLSIPYVASGGYQFFAAPAFGNFIKYEFLNTSGSLQTDFYYTTKFLTVAIAPQLLTTGAFIAPAMVASLGRNIIVGQDENGVFGNVSVTDTVNDAGSYRNLNVVSGARPSQLAGRVKVTEVIDTTVSVLQRTITAGKTFFITDIILTIDNLDSTSSGRVNLRDGLTVAGAINFPIQVQEAPTNESAVQVVSHQFLEPLEFSTGLFIEEGVGINIVTGVIIGYEE
jgi:hypothetical protein